MAQRNHLAQARNFSGLLALIERAFSTVHGAGEMFAYDVAHRIGNALGIAPEHVYLHRGTRDGARKLGLNARGRSMALDALPEPIATRLTPEQAEDFLCIFKDRLQAISAR